MICFEYFFMKLEQDDVLYFHFRFRIFEVDDCSEKGSSTAEKRFIFSLIFRGSATYLEQGGYRLEIKGGVLSMMKSEECDFVHYAEMRNHSCPIFVMDFWKIGKKINGKISILKDNVLV